MRARAALVLAAALVLGGLTVASSEAGSAARARAVALVVSGTPGAHGSVSAESDGTRSASTAVATESVSAGSGDATARASTSGRRGVASASAVARSVSVLDGVVTAYGVRREARADGARSTFAGSVDGLRIGDRFLGDVAANRSYPLPDGSGIVTVNRGTVGLRVLLTEASGGFPAGTDVQVAVVNASAADAAAPAATPTPAPTATPDPVTRERKRTRRAKKAGRVERRASPAVRQRLTSGGYAFPVYGPGASVADDWGGPRQIGPHQGNDIFAPFGSPVLAVADGVISKVGTLPISGNRLWLTTDGGDAFFYAHMSAFSSDAVDGRRVKAGTVLGFVGNTGDAEPTPPHLHFEIHPGGEGKRPVDPHPFLLAWQQRRDVAPGAWLQRHGDQAERPGALIAVRDFIADE